MAAHLQPKQPQGRDHESMDTSFRTKQTKDLLYQNRAKKKKRFSKTQLSCSLAFEIIT